MSVQRWSLFVRQMAIVLFLSLILLGGCVEKEVVITEEITPPSIEAEEERLRKLEKQRLTQYKLLGKLYLSDKRWSKAVEVYKKALALAPADEQIIRALDEIKGISGIDYRQWPIIPRKAPTIPQPVLRDFINDLTLILAGDTWRKAPVVADIDNDGDMELIIGLNAWHHDGTPVDGWPPRARTGGYPVVGDLDGDGTMEIVFNGTQVLRWNGIMMDGWPADRETGSFLSHPALSDLDGDGKLEVINGSTRDNKVYIRDYRGKLLAGWPQPTGGQVRATPSIGDVVWNVDGTLLPGWPKRLGTRIKKQATLADIDRDGKLDILVGSDRLYILDGRGNPLPGWEEGRTWNSSSTPSVADIDGDGEVEIFGAGYGWYNHDGSEIPTPGKPGGGWQGAVAGDINGDGKVEIIWTTRKLQTHAYRLDGTSSSGWPMEQGGNDGACTLADLDGDGDVEVIVATRNNRAYVWDSPGKFSKKDIKWPIYCANNWRTGVPSQIEWPGLKRRSKYRVTPTRRAMIKGDYESALEQFEEIAKKSRDEGAKFEALLSIARIYNFRLKKYEDAFDTYRRIILEQTKSRRMLDAFTELCDLYAMKIEEKDKFEDQFKEVVGKYQELVEKKEFDGEVPPGQALYLLAYGRQLAGDREAIELFQNISRDFKDTTWARLADRAAQFGPVNFFLNLELRKDIEYIVEKKDLRPGDSLTRRTEWDFVISPQNPYKFLFPCKATITSDMEVSLEERTDAKVIKEGEGKTKFIWDEKLSTTDVGRYRVHHHSFSIDDTVENKDVQIIRKCERLDENRQRVTISITAPYKVTLRTDVFRHKFSIEDEDISPKYNWKTSDIIVFGSESGRDKYDCTNGQDFTFIMRLPPEHGLYYPDVNVWVERLWHPQQDIATNLKEYAGTAEDYDYHILSTESFDLKQVTTHFWHRYTLKSITE